MFAAPVADIADSHSVKHSRYADDNNEFVTFSTANPFEMEAALDNLNNCLVDLMQWTRQNMLKLNNDKTKVIVFAPKKIWVLLETMSLALVTSKSHLPVKLKT